MIIKDKIYLPKSLSELKKLKGDDRNVLISRYLDKIPRVGKNRLLRILWYKIQCENQNLSVEQKNITRLNRYSDDPDRFVEKSYKDKYHLRSGLEIIKVHKGKRYKVLVNGPDDIIYQDQSYKTLSAAAKAICGKKVSGNDFFGINNKGKKSRGEPVFEKASV